MERRPDPIQKIIFTAISCLVTYQASLQGFRHLFYLQPQQVPEVAKVNYIMQVLGIFSYVTAKASVGYLILRLLPPKSRWRKWIIWSVIILTFIINSLDCIFTFLQCDPPKALWEINTPAHCWNPKVQSDFAIFVACKTTKCHECSVSLSNFSAAENILADFVLALLPISIFWNLNMSLKKRVNLCILLGLGLL